MANCYVRQVLNMSELVKEAVAEVDAFDKQGPPSGGEAGSGPAASAEVPIKVQLGRTAQANLHVRLYLQLSSWHSLSQVDSKVHACKALSTFILSAA